jgi:signal transduction histidine kinase/CheY-like chemotaxis protein
MNILTLIRENVFTQDPLIADIRRDLHRSLMANFSTIVFVFALFGAYLLLDELPRQLPAFSLLLGVAIFSALMQRIAKQHLGVARYTFVVGLWVALILGVWIYGQAWVVYLIVPLMLVGGLLMARMIFPLGMGTVLVFIVWAWRGMINVPLLELSALVLMSMAVIHFTVDTFYIALSWYGKMHQRADKLLEDARNHRAELLQTVKSLENSYLAQKRLQQQLLHARHKANEARQLKERFAANISHELRTPLNLIMGFSEIMYMSPSVYGDVYFPPRLTRDIYQIHRSSKYLLEMIDDVLDLSHVELSNFTLNFETTPLNEFLNETVGILQSLFNDAHVQFHTDIAPNLPALELDKIRFRQVLLNLFTNAKRFTERGSVTLRVFTQEQAVIFEVIDTGIGIEADKLSMIFDEFYQVDYSLSRSHGGTGLGLAISKRFVEAHNGKISATSVLGYGATFTVSLPINDRASVAYQADPLLPEDERQVVLFLEKDSLVISMVQRYLNQYQVVPIRERQTIPNAIEEWQPKAIIHNISPYQPYEPLSVPDDVLYVQCALPGSSWMVEQLGVAACLAKPITSQMLAEQLAHFKQVHTLLIVDDDLGFVQLVQRSLEMLYADLKILRAYDGGQALDMIKQSPPDLIFLDLAMPEMSGFEVIDALHADANLKTIPIVLITGTRYANSELEQSSTLTLQKHDGLKPSEVLHCLKALLNV